jgi:hypothetical protein
MKFILLMSIFVCISAIGGIINKKYPLGSWINECEKWNLDENKLCEKTKTWSGDFEYEKVNCVIFDECSFIVKKGFELIDKRIPNCALSNTIYIPEDKDNNIQQILLEIYKLKLEINKINLELDMKYKVLINFFQLM